MLPSPITEKASVGEAKDVAVANDKVIIQQKPEHLTNARDLLRYRTISFRGCRIAGWMIVDHDHPTSAQFQRPPRDLARIRWRVVDSAQSGKLGENKRASVIEV